MSRLTSIFLFCALVTTSAIGFAQAPPFENVLNAIDTMPTRAGLDTAYPDARERLMAAAGDDSLGIYARHRAITLLSLYPDATTRAFLKGLARDAEEAEVRKMAVYTLGRAFGTPGDAALVALVRGALTDEEAVVREWAVRSLRWIADPSAEQLLIEVARTGSPNLQAIAKRALRKRPASTIPGPAK